MTKKLVKVKVEVVVEVDDTSESNVQDLVSEIFTHQLEWKGIIRDWQYRKGLFNMKLIKTNPEDYEEGDAFNEK